MIILYLKVLMGIIPMMDFRTVQYNSAYVYLELSINCPISQWYNNNIWS